MSVLPKLSSSLNRRDEVPNQELANELSASNNTVGIKELVAHLKTGKKAVKQDCIKVLYEIGYLKPDLISPYLQDFVPFLNDKNNRLQWGAMTALSTLTKKNPQQIFELLPAILQSADSGSVITKDQAFNILVVLGTIPEFNHQVFPIMQEQLLKSLPNQLPMYAEKALPIIAKPHRHTLAETLKKRLNDLEKESKRKRLEKVIKKLSAS